MGFIKYCNFNCKEFLFYITNNKDIKILLKKMDVSNNNNNNNNNKIRFFII